MRAARSAFTGSPQEWVDKLEADIVGRVFEAADATIGRSGKYVREIRPLRWTPELRSADAARRERLLDLEAAAEGGDDDGRQQAYAAVVEASRLYAGLVHQSRWEGWREFVADMDQLESHELMKMLKSMGRSATQSSRAGPGSDPNNVDALAEHFRRQYQAAGDPAPVNIAPAAAAPRFAPIGNAQVVSAIRAMPNGKATGRSKLDAEMLKPIADLVAPALSFLFNECIRVGKVPGGWKEAILVPIPKNGSDSAPADFSNYRPISVLEHLRKLFEKVLFPALTERLEPLDISQSGFRSRRGTLDPAAALQEVMVQFRHRFHRAPEIAFLDIKAAYDSVDRQLLFAKLAARGIPHDVLQTIIALSDGNRSRVVVGEKESAPFEHSAGVMQGSLLSPLLYSVFVDDLARELREAGELRLSSMQIGGLFYADDMAVVAQDPVRLQRLLDICERYSLEHRFRFNTRKSEAFGDTEYRLYGEPLTKCKDFKYLGIKFDQRGINWEMHFGRLAKKSLDMARSFARLGYNGRGMHERTKLQLFKTFLRPLFEYGLAIMPGAGNGKVLKLLERTQHDLLCRMLGVGIRTNAASIRSLLHVQSVRLRHDELRSRWALKLLDKNDAFIAAHALRAHNSRPKHRSCFQGATSGRLYGRMLAHRSAALQVGAIDRRYGWIMDMQWEEERRKERLRELQSVIRSPFINLPDLEVPSPALLSSPRSSASSPSPLAPSLTLSPPHSPALSLVLSSPHAPAAPSVNAATILPPGAFAAPPLGSVHNPPGRPPDLPKVSRPNAHQLHPDGKPHQLYAVSGEPHRVRRLVILWVIGKLVGKPPPCKNCAHVARVLGEPISSVPLATQSHMVTCGGLVTDIDAHIRRGKFRAAAAAIRRRLSMCLPRNHHMAVRDTI